MRAFILAGGFATRLWPLTERRAKPLLPLAGKPIITHLIEKIPAHIPVTVSTNAAFADGFKKWIDDLGRFEMELVVEGTVRDDQKLGALGSIAEWICSERIDDDLLILTGDNYLGFSLQKFLDAFHGNAMLAAHDIGDLQKAKSFGTVILEGAHGATLPHTINGLVVTGLSPSPFPSEARDGGWGWGEGVLKRVVAFEEKPAHPQSTFVSAGCVILPRNTLPILMEYAKVKPDNLGGIFEELLRRKIPVECFAFFEKWMDIGSFHSYLGAHKELIGESALISPSAAVESTELRGSVTIGENCVVKGSELADCMVFDNVTIKDCSLRNCVIDDGCVLEGIDLQNQMLRAGTRLKVG